MCQASVTLEICAKHSLSPNSAFSLFTRVHEGLFQDSPFIAVEESGARCIEVCEKLYFDEQEGVETSIVMYWLVFTKTIDLNVKRFGWCNSGAQGINSYPIPLSLMSVSAKVSLHGIHTKSRFLVIFLKKRYISKLHLDIYALTYSLLFLGNKDSQYNVFLA